ncbi:hypothetical protein EDB80DRAFT_837205 [Ilyonectria destructans]|nr:hypothetical protein EDB80DRAFT_837205 [Ilyonectria destructans]
MAAARDSLSPDENLRRPSFQAYIPANPSRLGQAWNADDTSTERDSTTQSPSSDSTKSHRSIAGLSATSDRSDEFSATRKTHPPVGTAQGQGQIREIQRRFRPAIQLPRPAIQLLDPATQLPHPAIQLPHPAIQLPHPQVDSPLPEGSWVNGLGQVCPPTPPGFDEGDRGQARLYNLPLGMIPSRYPPLSVDPNPPHMLIQVFGPPPPHVPVPMLGDHPVTALPGSQMLTGPPFGHHPGPALPGLPMGSPILTGPPLGHHPGPPLPGPPVGSYMPTGPPLSHHPGPALPGSLLGHHPGPDFPRPPLGSHVPTGPRLGHHPGPALPGPPAGSHMLTGPPLGHHPVATLPGLPVSSHVLTPTAGYMPQLSHSVSFDPNRSPARDRASNKTPPKADSHGDNTTPEGFVLNPQSPEWTPGNNL